MEIERYTEKARRVVFYSRYEASHLGDVEIKAIHLLLGLLHEGNAVFSKLKLPDGKVDTLRAACVKESRGGARISTSVDMALDPEAKSILQRATEEADVRKHKDIDLEDLLLGSLHVPSKAKDILSEHGFSYTKVSAQLGSNPPLGDTLDYT